jgi:hypothetical protein
MDYSMDQLSRFITPAVRRRMSRVVAGVERPQDVDASGIKGQVIDVRALLRGKFGAP